MGLTFDKSTIALMSSFSSVTKSNVKDVVEEGDLLIFIVEPGQLFRAIGKKGANVKLLSKKLKKRIKIVEFNPEIKVFVRNFVYPLEVKDITQNEKIILVEGGDVKTKGLLIGRNAQNLRLLEKVVKRYFDITEIKVD
ncbi:NusA-like transcription termination signal-binding factor [Candidatus Woesearchaeota archaeon]|nr:NusA-like transcription termination signal-binding factor [Candidatus Woesearchaeota archaeon]